MDKPIAFVVMPFGSAQDGLESFWQHVYKKVFSPALVQAFKRLGTEIDVVWAKEYVGSASLLDKLVEYLIDARFVLVDITGNNANVLWEFGVRQALNEGVLCVRLDPDQKVDGLANPYPVSDIAGLQWAHYRSDQKEAVKKLAERIYLQAQNVPAEKNAVQRVLAEKHCRLVPNHRNYRTWCQIGKLLADVERLDSPLADGMLDSHLDQRLFTDPMWMAFRNGLLILPDLKPVPNLVTREYEKEEKRIRCTSVARFWDFWTSDPAYGDQLLKCSRSLKKRNGETVRIFTGLQEEQVRKNRNVFQKQKAHGITAKVIIEDRRKHVNEASLTKAFRKDLGKVIRAFIHDERAQGLVEELDLDMMIVNKVFGALRSLPTRIPDNIGEGLQGLFFVKNSDVGRVAYKVFDDHFNTLEGYAEEWTKICT